MNKTNVELEKRMSDLNKTNVELDKRMSVIKTNDKLNFDRKNAPYVLHTVNLQFCNSVIEPNRTIGFDWFGNRTNVFQNKLRGTSIAIKAVTTSDYGHIVEQKRT